MSWIDLTYGNGGWVRWEIDAPALYGLFRLADVDRRLRVVEAHLPEVPRNAGDLEIPLAQVNALAADPQFDAAVRARLDLPGPLLTVAASYYATSTPIRSHWVRDMFACQIPGSGVPNAPLAWVQAGTPPIHDYGPGRKPTDFGPEVTGAVDVPDGRPYGDAFYRQVAEVYAQLVWQSRKPVADIADANHVPLHTAQRWVREARRRKFLPPAQHGKRG